MNFTTIPLKCIFYSLSKNIRLFSKQFFKENTLFLSTPKIVGQVKSFAIFRCMTICNGDITWLKQFKPWKVPTMVGDIVVVGALTCALVHSMFYLKATQMNMQRNFIQELMLYKTEVSHNAAEAANIICCVKRGKCSWSYLPNPSARAGYDTRSIFKQSLTGLNSQFSFS